MEKGPKNPQCFRQLEFEKLSIREPEFFQPFQIVRYSGYLSGIQIMNICSIVKW